MLANTTNQLLIYLLLLVISLCKVTQSKLEGRIINGYAVDIRFFKFMGSLQVEDRHICGCTIVSKDVAITAAHCDIYPAEFYKIRVGSTYYDKGGKLLNVSKTIKHPEYKRGTGDNDISLLFFQEPLVFNQNENIAPAKLPPSVFEIPTGLGVTVIGWGTTDKFNNSATSTVLQSAALRTISTSDCKARFPFDAITENMFCAQNFNEMQDACTGDSGGPLMFRDTLLGVISWGVTCADKSIPGVYTNIPKEMDFIIKYVKDVNVSKTGI